MIPMNTTQVRVSIAIIKPGEKDKPKLFVNSFMWVDGNIPPQQLLEEKLDGMFEQLKDACVDEVYD